MIHGGRGPDEDVNKAIHGTSLAQRQKNVKALVLLPGHYREFETNR